VCAARGRQGPTLRDGVVTDIGSDTMVNLALAWAEAYARVEPAVRISVTGGGSGTGIAALINGTADIANASRKMKEEERQAAIGRGLTPREIVVARDAIAVVINASNPVQNLTISQISEIFAGRVSN
jgi:phosphate transport system substrate-binding protein